MTTKEQTLMFTFRDTQPECCQWLYDMYIKPHLSQNERLISISSNENGCNYEIARSYTCYSQSPDSIEQTNIRDFPV